MCFDYLDDESEKTLKQMLSCNLISGKEFEGESVEDLVKRDFVKGSDISTLSSPKPRYLITGLTQKGKSYFELKEKHEKELKGISNREWKIGIVGTIIGAILTYIIPILIKYLEELVNYIANCLVT